MSELPNNMTGGTEVTNTTQLINDFNSIDLHTEKSPYQQFSEQADKLLVEYLELYQQYKQLQSTQLNTTLKQCSWNLTELRHNSSYYSSVSTTNDSAKLLSSMCYMNRPDINALYTVTHNQPTDTLQLNHRTELSLTDIHTDTDNINNSDTNDSKLDDDSKSIEPVLRQRKPLTATQNNNDAKGTISDTSKSIDHTDTVNPESNEIIKIEDPIRWFTSLKVNYLKLQQTQSMYQSVLYTIVTISNIQIQMRKLETEYYNVKKQLDALYDK